MKTNINASRMRTNMRSLSVISLILIGCFAITSGMAFVVDPTGKSSGLHTAMLSNSPFQDFFVPGIFLAVFVGLPCIACAVFAAARWRQAPRFLSVQGWMLIVWILVEVAMLQTLNALHAICFATALVWLYTGNLLGKKSGFNTKSTL